MCSVYHVVVGVLSEKPYDVAVYMFTTIAVWIYSVMNYVTAYEARNTQKLVRLIVISTVGPVIIGFSIHLIKKYHESKAMVSAVVGNARPEIQAICNRIFLCDSLLKFDIQLGVSASILWIQRSLVEEKIVREEIIVVPIAVTITFLWGLIGYMAIRLENRILVWILFTTSPFEPGLFIFNIVRSHVEKQEKCFVPVLQMSMIACGAIAIVSRIATIWCMKYVMDDFGKGMKQLSKLLPKVCPSFTVF